MLKKLHIIKIIKVANSFETASVSFFLFHLRVSSLRCMDLLLKVFKVFGKCLIIIFDHSPFLTTDELFAYQKLRFKPKTFLSNKYYCPLDDSFMLLRLIEPIGIILQNFLSLVWCKKEKRGGRGMRY